MYCTKRTTAESSAVNVTPASSSTIVDCPRRRAAERPYTIPSAPIEPAKLASGTDNLRRSVTAVSGARNGHHRHVSGPRMELHVGVNAIQRSNVGGGQHHLGRPLRQDAAVLDERQLGAERRGEVQIVRRHDHG